MLTKRQRECDMCNRKDSIEKCLLIISSTFFLILCSPLLAGEDSPVYSNKDDTSGVNHLFDKGDGHHLYLTTEKDVYDAQYQLENGKKKERQKIILKKDRNINEEQVPTNDRAVRKRRSFANMAKSIRQKDNPNVEKNRNFSTFGRYYQK